jgi:hypothetical protein
MLIHLLCEEAYGGVPRTRPAGPVLYMRRLAYFVGCVG